MSTELKAELPKVHKEGCRLEFDRIEEGGSLVLLDVRRGHCYCIARNDFLDLVLALIEQASIDEPPTICDTSEKRILQSLYRIKHELNKQALKAKAEMEAKK